MPTILSIQSSVAYGHVGNSAATFPLMRMGIEVYPVLTVHFSNHTGYGSWRGPLLSAADVTEVIRGIDERGALAGVDAVLSGYQGAADMGEAILAAVRLVQSRNPEASYCCDPVIGDVDRGIYVRPGVPELIRDRVLPAAAIITPNQFELGFLTGHPTGSVADVLAAADLARSRGPETVLITSVIHAAAAPGTIDMIAVSGTGAWSVTTPLLPRTFTGAGDLTAATFLAKLLAGNPVEAALAQTAAVIYGVLATTVELGAAELQLVAAQDQIVAPTARFEVTKLR